MTTAKFSKKLDRRTTRPALLATSAALLLFALLMFFYVRTYRPPQQHVEQEGRIDNPPAPKTIVQSEVTDSVTGLVKHQAKNPQPLISHHVRQIRSPATPKPSPSSLMSATHSTPCVAPAPPPQISEKRRGFFGRMLNFFRRLFGRSESITTNSPPVICSVKTSTSSLIRPCPPDSFSQSCKATLSNEIQLTALTADPDGDQLLYDWAVTGGRVSGEGRSVTWDLTGVASGAYTVTVEVDDGNKHRVQETASVAISECVDCRRAPPPSTGVSVNCPSSIDPRELITFTASTTGGSESVTYNWSVSAGIIVSGQGTPVLKVDASEFSNQSVTATVSVGGEDPMGSNTASCTTSVQGFAPNAIQFNPNVNDERQRLDMFTIELQNDPGTRAAIIGYGTCRDEAIARATRAKNYLVAVRGIDPDRIQQIDGGCRERPMTQLWVVPSGASTPSPDTTGSISPCPECTKSIDKRLGNSILAGRVVGPDEVAVAHATVVLIGENNFRREVKTDSSGSFIFNGLPAGTYKLEIFGQDFGTVVVKEGHNALPEPIRVDQDDITRSKERDVIRISYPDYFLDTPPGEITFEWKRETRENEVVTSQTNANGRIEIIDRPPPIPGATPDVPVTRAQGDQYKAYATVTLLTADLAVVSPPSELQQSLASTHVSWKWKVKPVNNNAEIASFRFRIDLVWKAEGHPDKTHSYDWPRTFNSRVGPPLRVKLANYGSPAFALFGLITLPFGFRRRSSLLTEPEAEHEPVAAEATRGSVEVEEDVSSTIFAPRQAVRGTSFLVQVFAHRPAEDPATLRDKAKEAEPKTEKVGGNLLDQKVEIGTTLTFSLIMKGLEIDIPQQSGVWTGRTIHVAFGVTVPKDFQLGQHYGLVVVSADTLPIGNFRFTFDIVETLKPESSVPDYVGELTRFHNAFISYAHQDRAEVLKRVQMLSIQRQKYFQDFITIEPGQAWEPVIREAIDKCDVVYLFWSRAASASTEVKKELMYAVARQAKNATASPAILPIVIQGPPPADPPAELSFLHFDDKFSYLIFAAEASSRRESG
jgi:hypothetical protein